VAKAVADGLKAAEEEKDPVEAKKKTKSAVGRPQEIDRKTHFLRIHSID